jgi:3D-(3,5/4)-trihydroxycyclohexane-1,2-dione acylhydrolase (decyclizing)
MNRRLTVAQAIVAFLSNQYSSRDNQERKFFEGCFGIFGHGNVAGMGQALEQDRGLRYYLCRNEQAMVHTAAAFSKLPVAHFSLHNFDRTGRNEYGHWRSAGND